MAFHVELSERSQRDIEAAYEYIAAEASQAAADFRYGLQAQSTFSKSFRCAAAWLFDAEQSDTPRDRLIRCELPSYARSDPALPTA
jgi:hypothetical protein